MTAVVGLVKDGKVWLGADSAATWGDFTQSLLAERKIFRRGPLLFGTCGDLRPADILRVNLEVPYHDPDKYETAYHFMVACVVEAIRACLSAGGSVKKKNEVEPIPSVFLVGYSGHLFTIEEDLSCQEAGETYLAIGSGANVATGALHATKGRSPKPRILAALAAAAHHNASVRAPFYVEVLG